MGFDLIHILLSAQAALYQYVSSRLRAVTVWFDVEQEMLIFHFYYDGEINDKLFDLASSATAEADAGQRNWLYEINEDIVTRVDFPKRLPLSGRLVYLGYEPGVEQYTRKKYMFDHVRPLTNLFLYVQQALLGRVTNNLRTVSTDLLEESKEVSFCFIYDGPISDLEKEMAQAVIDETIEPFAGYRCISDLKRIDYPAEAPTYGQYVVYCRYEAPTESI